MYSGLVAAVFALQTAAAAAYSSSRIGALVNTTSGYILGGPASNATQVSQYLGIPFAYPPVGNLRFAPPVAYTSNRTINATSFAADCPQVSSSVPYFLPLQLRSLLGNLGQVNDTFDEDCLYLNVWTKPQSGSQSKPVLLWIYGGGFTTGGTSIDVYNGQYIADTEDVVVVSINYRVNIFGFPGGPNLTQNLGLLDQRLAVEWVRDNIAAFGGDPKRITIFGQSAGAASVDLYSYAWTSDPIVAGTILQSGAAFSFGNRLATSAAKAWYNVTATLGCGDSTTSTPDAILTCMRQFNITWKSIEQASVMGATGLKSVTGNFGPTVDNKTVFANYTDLAQKGAYIKTPSLIGNTNYEAGLFILIAAGAGTTLPASTWATFNDLIFTCPSSTSATYRAVQNVSTYRYYYSGMYPNLLLPTINDTQAYHTAELPVLFGTSQEATLTDSTWQQREFGTYLRGAWAAFARDPSNGLQNYYGWPRYSPFTQSLVTLGQDNATVASYAYPGTVDAGCTYPTAGQPNQ